MGRRGYPAEFRRKVLNLVESGRPVADVAKALGISDQTIYTWRRQDRIDKGLEPGLTSGEKSELAAAKQRIAALEAELAVHRRASPTPSAWPSSPASHLQERSSTPTAECNSAPGRSPTAPRPAGWCPR